MWTQFKNTIINLYVFVSDHYRTILSSLLSVIIYFYCVFTQDYNTLNIYTIIAIAGIFLPFASILGGCIVGALIIVFFESIYKIGSDRLLFRKFLLSMSMALPTYLILYAVNAYFEMHNTSIGILYFFVIAIPLIVSNYFIKEFEGKECVLGLCFIILVGIGMSLKRFGFEEIGHPFEKSHYSSKYFVNLFPDNNKPLNYRLIADINSDMVCYDDESYDEESSAIYCQREYRIQRIYLPNGKKIEFDIYNQESIQLQKKNTIIDESGNDWIIELTKIKAVNGNRN